MSKKNKTPDMIIKELNANLSSSYHHWKDMYENGCQDPCWEDGTNLNLVRNHIFYYKRQLEELLGNKTDCYPEEYYFPEPPELPSTFMSIDRNLYSHKTRDNPTGLVAKTKTMCYNSIMQKFEYSDMALF